MKYFINNEVLIQMELKLGRGFQIVTFFRHTHKVHKTKPSTYEDALKLFNSMLLTFTES